MLAQYSPQYSIGELLLYFWIVGQGRSEGGLTYAPQPMNGADDQDAGNTGLPAQQM